MRKIVGLGVAVLVVVALWSAGWFWGAGELRRQVEALAANDGETAPLVTCGTLDIGGFPFRFDLTCLDGSYVFQDETLTLEGLKASARVYSPAHVIFSAIGPSTMANAFTGSRSRFEFATLEGSARLEAGDLFKAFAGEQWRIGRISALVSNAKWYDTLLDDVLQASAASAELHLVDAPALHDKATGLSGLDAFLGVKGLDAPALQIAGGTATLSAEVSGLPDDLRFFGDPDLLRRWQSAGGTIRLVDFSGEQANPPETFKVTGALALNPAGLLTGKLDYVTKGVLDRFAPLLPPLQLVALKGLPHADGTFSNSLNISDGQVRLLAWIIAAFPALF